ncbi:hypothetical protein SAMN05192549_106313 [Duganella sacchari]|uniref:Uncharacterized protein n=1 Tax=Duganella sacchari TaxID=551987 RepID=A0A1M7Q7G0_9BURK|nr:hypothetical protein SAMN05192549_106313 [Duganella sacchari]
MWGVPAITGTLFFVDAHLPDVREAIYACFDEYEVLAKAHLTWLWREEPSEGPDKFSYAEAPPIRATVKRMKENDLFALTYIRLGVQRGLRPCGGFGQAMQGGERSVWIRRANEQCSESSKPRYSGMSNSRHSYDVEPVGVSVQ